MMLRSDIVEAVERGEFRVHSVAQIDQGIEILTGVKAGERDASGIYPEGTLYRMVEDKLAEFAAHARDNGSDEEAPTS